MARDHACVYVSIWDDPQFVELSCMAQRLYFFLLSQRDLTYCGLLPLRVRRWASRSADSTPDDVAAALAELDAARFVVADHDAEEVLVRSYVRRDGLFRQPNVLAAALREAMAITSPALRVALAEELRRLPVDVTGAAPGLTAAALLAGLTELPPEVKAAMSIGRRRSAVPKVAPSEAGSAVPAADETAVPAARSSKPAEPRTTASTSSQKGSRKGSAQPQGEGSRAKVVVVGPVQSAVTVVEGDPRAYACAPAREQAAELVRATLPGQPRSVADSLVTQTAALLSEGIDAPTVVAGLRLWAGKRLSVRLLPELVGEAIRSPMIAAQAAGSRSRTDDRLKSALVQATRYAVEDDDRSDVGRMLRETVNVPRGGDPLALGPLLAGATA